MNLSDLPTQALIQELKKRGLDVIPANLPVEVKPKP